MKNMIKLKQMLDFKLANQAYLINFTAAWCITCQANEKTSLGRASVKKYLVDNNIKYIKADWTNRDENITKSFLIRLLRIIQTLCLS